MARLLAIPPRTLSARLPVQASHVAGPPLRAFSNSVDQTVEPKPIYPNHIHLNPFQRGFLAIGSAFASLNNPYRADMIAVLSETTGGPFLARLRDQMLEDEGGRRLLRDRPRINTATVDLALLDKLPEGTFGKEYCNWLRWCNVSPDTREPVRFIDSPELAYVMQRYRECHDFYHVISGPFPVNISGEIVVKWVELANMGLPVAALSAIFGPLRLNSEKRTDLLRTYVPWALRMGSSCKPLICVEWEKNWETPISQLKRSLGISEPPVDFKTWTDLHRKQNS
ncbi:hypothetical protein PTTG_03525 [Puccinia triticina 1-1 BBBD Race 1]|uniref:4-hydroxy-3-methoxy-5-polyprenylbenzoate decarboxylase n=2 Tax=Puccinia triticina TaxID=208348 RepID=A0A0C4ERV5_PUCT1|nr:uncharacterized protein PtA15_18A137 [Puccinia triticina]OAV96830.1 hypothetical protein PTTG_03525 [Puccinia triticina 1-1 BBBD Race 1]WAQ93080.1 hypothetical protein PtA15_18A137 [Puccinia triticina]